MGSNPKTKMVGVYDGEKDHIEQLILNADYQNCIKFCKSAIHRMKSNLKTINNRHFMWYLHKHMGDCYFELGQYNSAISIFLKGEECVPDEEYKYRLIWFRALCHKKMNELETSLNLYNQCISFYESSNRFDMAFTIKISVADMLQDETTAGDAVSYLENYIKDDTIEKDNEIDYTIYLDEAYKTLALIQYNNGKQVMAYKSYKGIYNKENYSELKEVILS